MTSVEALGMCASQQLVRQADIWFTRSLCIVSRKFDKVLACLCKLIADIIRPKDPEFRVVHKRLQSPRFAPFFDKCIGAQDGTNVKVVVPANQVVPHMERHGYISQNVLALCDFDMRFTFAIAGLKVLCLVLVISDNA
jgi:hypothetical protein